MHDGLICSIIGLKIVMAEAEFGKKEKTGIKAEKCSCQCVSASCGSIGSAS